MLIQQIARRERTAHRPLFGNGLEGLAVLLGVAGMAVSPASGDIVHRVITPAQQVGLPSPDGRSTPVDVDGDGTVDLVIRTSDELIDTYDDGFGVFVGIDVTLVEVLGPGGGVLVASPSFGDRYYDAQAVGYGLGGMVGADPYAVPASLGVLCASDFYYGEILGLCWSDAPFAGFVFPIGGELHYGWLRFDFGTPSAPHIELAYQSTAGVPIPAGATEPPCPPRIVVQPGERSFVNSFYVFLAAQVLTSPGSTYQWTRDGAPVGENSPQLEIPAPRLQDSGRYVLTVTSACGSASTDPFTVVVPRSCRPGSAAPPDGMALDLRPYHSALRAPHAADLNAFPITLEAWVNDSSFTTFPGVVNKYYSSSRDGYNLYVLNGEVRAWYFKDFNNFVWDDGVTYNGLNGGSVRGTGWRHIAAVFDESGGRLFVDGELRDQLGWTGTPGPCTTTEPLSVGFYPSPDQQGYLSGIVDEVRIWNYARTREQINADKDRRLPAGTPGLLVHYTFEGAIGADDSGLGHEATVVNRARTTSVSRCCRADFNGDGSQDPDDLSDFISEYFATPAGVRTDLNSDGATDPDDLSDFISEYFRGC